MDAKKLSSFRNVTFLHCRFFITLKISFLFIVMLFTQTGLFASDIEIVLTSAGCKTEYFLIRDLINGYRAQTNKGIQIKKTGNKKATEMLLNGEIDFSFTCKKHKKLLHKFGYVRIDNKNWRCIKIASDPIGTSRKVGNIIGNAALCVTRPLIFKACCIPCQKRKPKRGKAITSLTILNILCTLAGK